MEDDFDPDSLSDQELLVLPLSNIDPAKSARFISRRSTLIEKKDAEQSALEMTPGHHGPHSGNAAGQQERIALQQFLAALEDFREREDRLIAAIEDNHLETLRHLQDIDDRAIKLRDGRRAYVDGGDYRDKDGSLLRGADRDEADRLKTRNSSTWKEKSEWQARNDREALVLHDLREDRQKLDSASGKYGSMTDSQRAKLVGEENALVSKYEKETNDLTKTYSADYAAAYGIVASPRTASYAGTMDGSQNQNRVGGDFAAAATGPADSPAQRNRTPAPSTAPVPGTPT